MSKSVNGRLEYRQIEHSVKVTLVVNNFWFSFLSGEKFHCSKDVVIDSLVVFA